MSSFQQPVFDAGYGSDYGADVTACEVYRRRRAAALKKMWKTPIFTKKRLNYERQAIENKKLYQACVLRVKRGARPSFTPASPAAKTKAAVVEARAAVQSQRQSQGARSAAGIPDPAATDASAAAASGVPEPAAGGVSTGMLVVGGVALLAVLAAFALGGTGGGGQPGGGAGPRTASFKAPAVQAHRRAA